MNQPDCLPLRQTAVAADDTDAISRPTRQPSHYKPRGFVQLAFSVLAMLGAVQSGFGQIPDAERAALQTLYGSTNGGGWNSATGWNNPAGTECSWQGITCTSFGGIQRVTSIYLSNNNLTGTLPALPALTSLVYLYATHNQMTGAIPNLTSLGSLQLVYLNNNQFTSGLPGLLDIPALQYLNVSHNQFTGTVPSLVGRAGLRMFDVNNNQLSGAILSLSGMTALQVLYVNNNQLTGNIPPLNHLGALEQVDVGGNKFTGSIPSLNGLSALKQFSAYANKLSGVMPMPPSSLVASGSGMCGNQLSGTGSPLGDAAWDVATGMSPVNGVPGWRACQNPAPIPEIERTTLLDLYNATNGPGWATRTGWNGPVGSECEWHGVVCVAFPFEGGMRFQVSQLNLGQNGLAGMLPALSHFKKLQQLYVHNNQLTGNMPELTGMTLLKVCAVNGNQLSGALPELKSLTSLQTFFANTNQFTGSIPELAGLVALRDLALDQNQLSGPIPDLAGLGALRHFSANQNQLFGRIPDLNGLTALKEFWAFNNQLSGQIPSLAGLASLRSFDVGGNRLDGDFPSLAGLSALEEIYVYNNQLEHELPPFPNPSSLIAGRAGVCGNNLTVTGDAALDAAWDVAAGTMPVNGKPGWVACQYDSRVRLLNPMRYALERGSYAVSAADVIHMLKVDSVSADENSAVVVALASPLPGTPVTFTATQGTMTAFEPNYLSSPAPGNGLSVTVNAPASCEQDVCTYLALFWAPATLPVSAGNPLSKKISLTATQAGRSPGAASLRLQPPPLLLVHGVWSSAKEAAFAKGTGGFRDWISAAYPADVAIAAADYGVWSATNFADAAIQNVMKAQVRKLLYRAANNGMAARRIDVVGHSMGGLATRYLLKAPAPLKYLPPDPVHALVTIGTPHKGSPLATKLLASKDLPLRIFGPGFLAKAVCDGFQILLVPCAPTLSGIFSRMNKDVSSGGVASLMPSNPNYSQMPFPARLHAIGGQSPLANSPSGTSVTQLALDFLIAAFVPESVDSLLGGTAHDTIVALDSQLYIPSGPTRSTVQFDNIVHTALQLPDFLLDLSLPQINDIGETRSRDAWDRSFEVLTGSPAPSRPVAGSRVAAKAGGAPPPFFDLTGYTEVAGSNVSYSPTTGAALTIGVPVDIVATSGTKTISQVLLFQAVVVPGDTAILFATESPFVIAFNPGRVGAAKFAAVTFFSDMTFAVSTLNYAMQPAGIPASLSLESGEEQLLPGMAAQIKANAAYPNGPVDITLTAIYAARSGTSAVFSIGANGVITSTGAGTDWLDVSYLGLSASAKVSVIAAPRVLDVDGNNAYDALTDGLLVIRYLFGLTGASLTNGAVGFGAPAMDPQAMLKSLNDLRPQLDIDGNGQVDALTDGLMLIRYLFGLRGASLVAGVVAQNATRTTAAQVESYIQTLMP